MVSLDLLSWKAKECSGWKDGLLDRENDAFCPEFCEEPIVYLDDIVELSNVSTGDEDLWDQRFFKFKSHVTTMRENHGDSTKRSSKSIKFSERSRRRLTCRERENHSLSHTKKKCYNYEAMISEKTKNPPSTDKRLDIDLFNKGSHDHHKTSRNRDSDEEIEFDTYSGTKRIRSCEIGTVVYDVFMYSHCQPEESITKCEHESSLISLTKCMKSTEKYYPSHVHPKLPDYDEITAKFIALKREYLQQTKQHQ